MTQSKEEAPELEALDEGLLAAADLNVYRAGRKDVEHVQGLLKGLGPAGLEGVDLNPQIKEDDLSKRRERHDR